MVLLGGTFASVPVLPGVVKGEYLPARREIPALRPEAEVHETILDILRVTPDLLGHDGCLLGPHSGGYGEFLGCRLPVLLCALPDILEETQKVCGFRIVPGEPFGCGTGLLQILGPGHVHKAAYLGGGSFSYNIGIGGHFPTLRPIQYFILCFYNARVRICMRLPQNRFIFILG